jgi:hypothetical protein
MSETGYGHVYRIHSLAGAEILTSAVVSRPDVSHPVSYPARTRITWPKREARPSPLSSVVVQISQNHNTNRYEVRLTNQEAFL